MRFIHAGAVLRFQAPEGAPVQVGTAADPQAAEPDAWQDASELGLPAVAAPTLLRVFARIRPGSCPAEAPFAFTYELREAYPPPAGQAGSTAVAAGDASIVGWASAVEEVDLGPEVDAQWQRAEEALGPADGSSTGIVSLGRGGSITLAFDPPIADGPGFDLAVFENGFLDDYLELAQVEVSSDGTRYLRFDHAFLGDEPVDAFGTLDTTRVGSLAGKYRQGFGTPFDLAVFAQAEEVRAGRVDLGAIRYVRIVDVIGDGSALDSFGQPIFDPFPTAGSAGFDLDAVAALHAAR